MAVIFFEGFNNNRRLDAAYWTTPEDFVSGGAGGRYSPGQSANIPTTTPAINLTLNNFGQHSAKKFYIGFAIYNFGARDPEVNFLRASNAAGDNQFRVLLTPQSDPTKIIVSVYRLGALLGTYEIPSVFYWGSWTGVQYLPNWTHIQIEIDMLADPNTFALRINDDDLLTTDGDPTIPFDVNLTNISKLEFFGTNLEYTSQHIDDLYLSDLTTITSQIPNGWLGSETIVYPLDVTNDGNPTVSEWARSGGGGVTTDDSDSSTIRTSLGDKKNLYSFNLAADMTSKVIGGLRVNSIGRKVSLTSSYVHIHQSQVDDQIYTLGATKSLTSAAYKARSDLLLTNPATSAAWTTADINSGKFGVKSILPGA